VCQICGLLKERRGHFCSSFCKLCGENQCFTVSRGKTPANSEWYCRQCNVILRSEYCFQKHTANKKCEVYLSIYFYIYGEYGFIF
jgi:hypothetical protein